MSDRTLGIRITATENASGVFKTVGTSATQAGDAIEQAGKEGAEGLDQVERAAKEADASLDRVGDTALQAGQSVETVGESAKRSGVNIDQMGVALTALGAGFAYAGNLAMEHERTIVALQQGFKDAADDMIAFADTLAAETGNLFNDDDILRGERWFITLRENYGLTIDQIQEVARVTADLAAASNVTFEDAANRVTAALRGEAEAAEALGLTMNQQAIDRENLTLSMTNQEAAQFRLNALLEQSVTYQGTAAKIAETSAGAVAEWTNRTKDAAQAAGEFVGPMGSLVAGLGLGVAGLGQFAGGLGTVATALRTATTAGAAFIASPLGLTITAVGGAIALATGLFMEHRQAAAETAQEWKNAEAAASSLEDQIRDLALVDWDAGRWAREMREDIEGEFDWQGQWLRDTLLKSFGTGDWFDQQVSAMFDPSNFFSEDEIRREWERHANIIIDSMIPDGADYERVRNALGDILSLEGQVGDTTFDAIQANVEQLFAAFNAADGRISIDQFIAQLEYIYDANLQAAQGLDATTIATNRLAAAQQTWLDLGAGSIGAAAGEMEDYAAAAENAATSAEHLAEVEAKRNELRVEEEQARQDAAEAWEQERDERVAQEQQDHDERVARFREVEAAERAHNVVIAEAEEQAYNERHERREQEEQEYLELVEARKAAARELIASVNAAMGTDDPLDQWNMAGLGTGASQVAGGFADAAAAAGDLFRIVVGNTNAIKSQADATLSWATELINVRGEFGRIDELLANDLISDAQYDAAQDAYDSIAISTATIADNLDAVQAIQAPLLAESQAALAAYTDELRGMSAEQQLVALAWMDSATAAKAMEIQTLAVSAAMGELGPNGEQAVTSMIQGLTAANPALEALLVDMGLISVTMDEFGNKTISVNFEGASETNAILQELTQSIQMLVDWLDDGSINGSIEIEDNATPVIQNAWDYLDSVNGATSTTYVETEDNASPIIAGVAAGVAALNGDTATTYAETVDRSSGTLDQVRDLINSLDGRTATTYVKTIYSTSGTGILGDRQMHGGVPGFASGGVPFYGAEGDRPEMLHFANGGTMPIFREGLYVAPGGTYVSPPNANPGLGSGGLSIGPIIIQGSVITERELIGKAAEAIWSVEVQEKIRERVAAGVMA